MKAVLTPSTCLVCLVVLSLFCVSSLAFAQTNNLGVKSSVALKVQNGSDNAERGELPASDSIGTLADWTQVVVAIVNLAFVVIVFFWSVGDRKTQSRREAHIFWIQEVILLPNRALLSGYFSKWVEKLIEIDLQKFEAAEIDGVIKGRKELYLEFKDETRSVRSEIVEPLCALSPEFNKLNIVLNSIQDLVSTALEKMPSLQLSESEAFTDEVSAYRTLKHLKSDFLSTMWEAQVQTTKLEA